MARWRRAGCWSACSQWPCGRCSRNWRQRRSALIAVRDQGSGIPGYAQDKVFEKFYSLARPHSQKKSTGLGLSFVKEIAALHHGRIELHNRPDDEGPGTVATLALPRAPA